MSVLEKVEIKINSFEFLMCVLGTSLSLLLIGYAPSSITLGLFCVLSFRYFVVKRIKAQLNFVLILPVFLYLTFVASYFWSVDPDQTIKGLGRTVILLLLPIAFSIIPQLTLKNYELILRIFTFSNAILASFFLLSALYQFILTRAINVFTYHNLVSVLDLNAIYVTIIFSVSLFYLMSLKNKTTLEKSLIFYFLLLILLLSSKIIVLILFFAFIFFIFNHKIYSSNKKKIVVIILSVIIGLIISSISLYERFSIEKKTELKEVFNKDTFGNVYYWTGTSIRLFQLRILKEQLEQESILFHGFGLFASKENIKKRHLEYDTYYGFHDYNYHNQYAQILAETGLIGLLLLITILIVLTFKAVKSRNYGFIMFSIMTILIFFTESFLWRQRGLFLFVILFCIYNRTLFNQKNNKNVIG